MRASTLAGQPTLIRKRSQFDSIRPNPRQCRLTPRSTGGTAVVWSNLCGRRCPGQLVVRHPSLHMISLIHIADKNDEASIIKNGLRAGKRRTGPRGVYAVPVIPNHATTHQWARELKRRGVRTLICVQFRIPSSESVLVGKYNGDPQSHRSHGVRGDHSEENHAQRNHTDLLGSANNGLALLSRCKRQRAVLSLQIL